MSQSLPSDNIQFKLQQQFNELKSFQAQFKDSATIANDNFQNQMSEDDIYLQQRRILEYQEQYKKTININVLFKIIFGKFTKKFSVIKFSY